jgi:hypothetical protein
MNPGLLFLEPARAATETAARQPRVSSDNKTSEKMKHRGLSFLSHFVQNGMSQTLRVTSCVLTRVNTDKLISLTHKPIRWNTCTTPISKCSVLRLCHPSPQGGRKCFPDYEDISLFRDN